MDKELLDIVSNVVWRFHVYEQYGKKPEKAIKALSKRATGYTNDFYKETFDLNLRLLVETINAVSDAPKKPKLNQVYSQYSDVDIGYVLKRLHKIFPNQTDKFITSHLSMSIYWFYLR
ncbi:MAG TPA: hypothetical protein DEP19_06955 [Anaerolineae bacterium]|nr:hypothetical protein [Anaerolineae bacterium]HCK65837.1 hypothetical protein [Anaerolineae bacterium]